MNMVYKIFSKTLAIRLEEIVSELLSTNQSTFTKSNLISYNVAISWEMMIGFDSKSTPQ